MAKHSTIWLPYTQMLTAPPPLEVVATQGSSMKLANGKILIDSVASWWTAAHGYNHPHLVNAIQEQAAILPHVMLGGVIHPQVQKLSQRLVQRLPGDLNHVFFSESGSVSIEIAMKMALQYWQFQHAPQKQRFVSFQYGYHGDTLWAMSVCDPHQSMHKNFPILPNQYCQPIPSDDALLDHFTHWISQNADEVAGVLIEPLVQGAGGMKMHSAQVLRAIAEICQQRDILFIVDEIFTGFGRTGSLFAIEQAQIVPDIICLSKALTGGMLPLAATIAREKVYQAFLHEDPAKCLMHGPTFTGNALACAAANASLDLFDTEPRLQQAQMIENWLVETWMPMASFKGIKAVRVKGAIGVIQFERQLTFKEINWFKAQCLEDGVFAKPFDDILYTTPALTIDKESLLKITNSFSKQLQEWSSHFTN